MDLGKKDVEKQNQNKSLSENALREEAVLSFWKEHNIFEKSLSKNAPKGEFVFYDGPPFATGLPHHGHILASTIKDAIPRYKTMRGYHVPRKWGWDCHGLPLENIIEERLGLKTKRDIEELGIEKFNEAAKGAVMEYADEWRRIIPRMGRFVDMDNDYKTMDASYTESVWWSFKQLNEKGLVYEGFKSMHLCPRCGTTLSNFEVNQGYKDIKDIAVTVKLPLLDEKGEQTDTSLLVWTTTPWTLPGNMAAAVHKDFIYAKVKILKEDGQSEFVILTKDRIKHLNDDSFKVVEEIKGADLVGKSYQPPFDYWKDQTFEGKEHAWKIYHADYVEVGEEGTGAVHLAPAYGEEDMLLAQREGVPIVHHVGSDGRFLDVVIDFKGMSVKPKDDEADGVSHLDADIAIVRALNASNRLMKKENITHSYPHCWRCDTPLLNYATTSWFVKVTDIKDDLVKENKKVHWVPEHVGANRFGKWLNGARDWAVSRQRYWGAPLPVWRNKERGTYNVIGSLEELKTYIPRSGNEYFLMRHGESQSNVAGIVATHKDDDSNTLTKKGREEVINAVTGLEEVDVIIHSGYARTRDTAKVIAEIMGLEDLAVIEDSRIDEVRTGEAFEGKTWKEYYTQFSDWGDSYTRELPARENRRDVQIRTGEFLYELEKKYAGKKILIISHGGTLFGLECAGTGADPKKAHDLRKERGTYKNAEIRTLDFVPIPHNQNYELDYHRPYIDEVELYEDGARLERVPDIFDCWYESGSMPFAQKHYPFSNTDVFNPKHGFFSRSRGYPADFIAEGLDQTRGWFYSLIVLGTALFGCSPYKNVIVNGLALAEDGKKMSKSLKNYPDPMLIAGTYGADTMRFYLLSSPIIKGEDLNFSEKSVAELSRKNIGRLHNVLSFYEMYTDEHTVPVSTSTHVLDAWIRARLAEVVTEITEGFEHYELDRATRPIIDFIDDLSVWYVRRSRDRFKGSEVERQEALGTVRFVLLELAKVIAPSMPFYAEHLYRTLRTEDDVESVHLADWPEAGEVNHEALDAMRAVREGASLGLEARSKAGIAVRQPLQTLTLRGASELANEYLALIRDEVNVKEVIVDETLSEPAVLDLVITDTLRDEGTARELMRYIQDLRKKQGMDPEDRVILKINTSEEGKEIIEKHKTGIISTVGATSIVYGPHDGATTLVNEISYTFLVNKET